MKNMIIIAALSVFYFAAAGSQVFADGNTYKRVVCSPDNYKPADGKKCLFKFKLKSLQTKEFRGHCAAVDSSGTTKTYQPKAQDCRENNKANSCTATMDPTTADPGKKYMSCSCTNWDVTTSHNVRVMINCSGG